MTFFPFKCLFGCLSAGFGYLSASLGVLSWAFFPFKCLFACLSAGFRFLSAGLGVLSWAELRGGGKRTENQKFRKGVGGQRVLARRNPSKARDLGLFSAPFFLCPLRRMGSHTSGELFGLSLGVCLSPTPSRQPLFETSEKSENLSRMARRKPFCETVRKGSPVPYVLKCGPSDLEDSKHSDIVFSLTEPPLPEPTPTPGNTARNGPNWTETD